MKLLPQHWIFIFLLVCSNESAAQTQNVKFDLVTGANGIYVGKINGMTMDKYGFMWFSDQSNRCIVRYDGNKMIRYQNIINNPNSLGGVYPEVLFADSSGIIWIGFFGMGLDRFDPQTNTFTHYRHKKDDPESLSGDYLQAILVDHLGNIWVGSDGGLDLLDEKTGKFKHYQYKADDPTSISSNQVRIIYEDKAGELWIGTGWPWGSSKEGGLNRFDRKTGTFTRYLNEPKNPNSLIENPIRAIFEDSKGNFWIGTIGDGLHTMDRKTGVITRQTYNAARPEQLSRPPIKSRIDHITFITEDAEKKLWIGTFENGIVRYDPETKKTTHYTNYNHTEGITKDTSSWWAHTTPDGLLWLSTQSGNLYRIDLFNKTIPHVGNSGKDGIRAFCEEPASVLWLGTQLGLVRKDLKNGTSKLFVHEPGNSNSLSSNNVSDIIKDKKGNLWIGTYDNGLNRFNPETNTFTRYLTREGKDSSLKSILVLYEDKESTIWAGVYGLGVIHLDPNTGKLTKYISNEVDSNSLNNGVISSILEADSMYMWFGSPNTRGLNRLNRQTGKFKLYLPGLTIDCLFKDRDGIIWVGSEGGLLRYDNKSDIFYSGTSINDALNIPNAFSIVGDNDNNLWVVSSPGIYKINQRRDHATLYSKESGIAQGNDFYSRSAYKGLDGKLYFGNGDGYFSLYPDNIDNKPASTQFYFTNFWLNNIEIRPGANSLLQQSIFETKEILLKHNQNVFSFGFSVINFRDGDKRVYYKLENYDKDWRTAGSENKAEYYKIPPGTYFLHIKTINSSNGEWMEKSIRVIISPPWWTTWWAYIIYGLLFIALIVFIDRFQKARVIKAEREKTRTKELAQAKEIEKAYQELKTTQKQLIQSEKMASLGELTAGIAHEIQNPLNFVNNFSEVSNELLSELSEEVNKGNYDEVKLIAKDVQQNLEKINHHGKRADAIVKGMLAHSRTSTGQKEPTDINVLCDEYLRLAYHGMKARNNSFEASFRFEPDNTLPKVNIVPQDMGRVLLNLINNAFQAVNGFGDKPTVTVSTEKIENVILIKVADNGPGIPDAIKDKIFQPFFTTKPTGQGTGLGLSLSYDIVKAHGGELKVETKEGEETTFIIQLPA